MLQVLNKTNNMTPEQFVFWLQGFCEINGYNGSLTGEQWKIICDHLKLVFDKKTPDYNDLWKYNGTGMSPVIFPTTTPTTGTPNQIPNYNNQVIC